MLLHKNKFVALQRTAVSCKHCVPWIMNVSLHFWVLCAGHFAKLIRLCSPGLACQFCGDYQIGTYHGKYVANHEISVISQHCRLSKESHLWYFLATSKYYHEYQSLPALLPQLYGLPHWYQIWNESRNSITYNTSLGSKAVSLFLWHHFLPSITCIIIINDFIVTITVWRLISMVRTILPLVSCSSFLSLHFWHVHIVE